MKTIYAYLITKDKSEYQEFKSVEEVMVHSEKTEKVIKDQESKEPTYFVTSDRLLTEKEISILRTNNLLKKQQLEAKEPNVAYAYIIDEQTCGYKEYQSAEEAAEVIDALRLHHKTIENPEATCFIVSTAKLDSDSILEIQQQAKAQNEAKLSVVH